MATMDSLIGHCLVELPGAPQPLIGAALVVAARKLCLESSCWSEAQAIALVADQTVYVPVAPSEAVPRLVKSVLFEGRLLTPMTLDSVMEMAPGLLTSSGQPAAYYVTAGMVVNVLPRPDALAAGKSLRVDLAFVPTLAATTIPDVLIEPFAEALLAGAKARLMAMAGREWSNPQMAMVYQGEFVAAVADAEIDVLLDHGRGSLAVVPRRFG